tara:strand:+ start:1236 stop:2249 length:1014 start_codon:yes stop_codon:yes gene_type:complete
MNKLKVLLITLLVFILLNAIIVFLWPIRTNLKFADFIPYNEEFFASLNLNQEEALKLYLETWQRERLFEYDEFTGVRESESVGEFVNISKQNGRLISNNPKTCSKNIFFYGGEIVFGYDVTDNQSIPFYLREILINNNLEYCVFNFGRRTYFSTQENILLQKHLNQNKINKEDIIIFINGENENGNNKLLNTNFIEKNYNNLHKKYWNLYKSGIVYFINLLPISQAIEILSKKTNFNKSVKSNNYKSNLDINDIYNVFNNNIKNRNAICKEHELVCYNFLFFLDPENSFKYEKFKDLKNVNDFTMYNKNNLLLNKFNSINPQGNKLIAQKIYEIILN